MPLRVPTHLHANDCIDEEYHCNEKSHIGQGLWEWGERIDAQVQAENYKPQNALLPRAWACSGRYGSSQSAQDYQYLPKWGIGSTHKQYKIE